jgi:hypothetical protein
VVLKRYQDFILESFELLLESNVIYSDKFRGILSKIESPIAKRLLDIENKDYPVRSNYFDIVPGKNDSITFLNDRKAEEILNDTKEWVTYSGDGGTLTHNLKENGELFNQLGYTPEGDAPYKPTPVEVGEVINKVVSPTSGKTWVWVKFSNGQGVYNQTKLRKSDDKTSRLWGRGRQDIGIGRGIRALLTSVGEKIVDKELEQFVNLYKSTMDKFNDKFQYFEEVKGDMIAHFYNKRNYGMQGEGGQLYNSCMSSVPWSYFHIYTENTDRVSMVIYRWLEDTDKIIGRALVWTLNDGKRFMDRIYCVKDSDIQLFKEYAKERGIYSKHYNSSTDSGLAVSPTGEQVKLDLTVSIRKGYYDNYPYLDTLKYWSPSGIISNKKSSDSYTLEDTSGEYVRCDSCGGSGRVECYDCGGRGTWECDDCYGRGTTSCGDCDGDGKVDCSTCDGSGKDPDNEESECNNCSGEGRIECGDCGGYGKVDCDNCNGDGRFDCDSCGGDGEYDCSDCN